MRIARRLHSCVRGCTLLLALLLGSLILLHPTLVHAQQADPPPLEVAVSMSPRDATLGERVRITVIVTHPAEVLVSIEPPVRTAALVPLTATPETTMQQRDGSIVSTFAFTVVPINLGEISPALVVQWLRADGTTGLRPVNLPTVRVLSTVPPAADTLAPLKSQLEIDGAPPAWRRAWRAEASVGAAVALLIIAVLTVRAWLHRPRPLPPLDTRAEDAARGALTALSDARLLTDGAYGPYYGGIATAVRAYLQQRFAFPATAMTSTELTAHMTARGVDRWQARLVTGLLERCDAAVYAHRHPDPASADHDLTLAFEIIELTRPRLKADGIAAMPDASTPDASTP